ncbi:MAG: Na+/H+ antiporter NhaC [Bacilli bacterium]|jgi:NhaC family Na+:H+ antiporter|nr:Na+/H+ antiporter NhaC [Bacilli bacterium]
MSEIILPEVTGRRKVFGLISVVVLVALLMFFVIGPGYKDAPLDVHLALIGATIFVCILGYFDGTKWAVIEKGIISSIMTAMQACLILLVIGILIASWITGGIVQAMIYYGLGIISPQLFFFTALILCSIVALATGSSWTTAGTVGVALIGIAGALNIPMGMAAGAIVSGAYFGDKMSPLSDTTNLAPAVAGTTLFDHIKSMVYTTIPSYIIAAILFIILGFMNSKNGGDLSQVKEMQAILLKVYNINLLLLIPPLVIVAMVVFKLPAIPGLFLAVLLGVLCTIFFQGLAPENGIRVLVDQLHYGYTFDVDSLANSGFGEKAIQNMADLLSRGGFSSMLWTVSLIFCAMSFGGAMEATGFLVSLVDSLKFATKKRVSLITTSILTGVAVNFLAADQYVSIAIPGRMYNKAFRDLGLAPRVQSRVLESGGTLTSPLCPWNTCGATMSSFLGVNAFTYLPFAWFNLINPVVEIISAAVGWAMFPDDGSDHVQNI